MVVRHQDPKAIEAAIKRHQAEIKRLRNELKIAEIKLEVHRPSKDFEKEVITKSDLSAE